MCRLALGMGTLDRKAKAGDASKMPISPTHWSWRRNWAMPMPTFWPSVCFLPISRIVSARWTGGFLYVKKVSGLERLIYVSISARPWRLGRAITCGLTSRGSKIRPLLRNARRSSPKSLNDRRPSFLTWMEAPILNRRDYL